MKMKAAKFSTTWILAVVLATCFASTTVMAQSGGGLSGPATPAPAVKLSDGLLVVAYEA